MDKPNSINNDQVDNITKQPKINYSDSILHVVQTGMQCWSRSSQMIISYVLSKLHLNKDEIKKIFYSNLFLESDFEQEIPEEEYLNLNQRILGRRLRENEEVKKTLDELVVKIYAEFGSTSFLAEVFPSFIKTYLQAFSRIKKRFQDYTVTLIMDNDNPEEIYMQENSCTIVYKTFPEIFNNGFRTGLLKGDDKEFWESLESNQKVEKLVDLLHVSPILIESPGHAFVLSGYLPEDKKFIINDSLSSETNVIKEKNLLKSLSSLVLLAKIEKN